MKKEKGRRGGKGRVGRHKTRIGAGRDAPQEGIRREACRGVNTRGLVEKGWLLRIARVFRAAARTRLAERRREKKVETGAMPLSKRKERSRQDTLVGENAGSGVGGIAPEKREARAWTGAAPLGEKEACGRLSRFLIVGASQSASVETAWPPCHPTRDATPILGRPRRRRDRNSMGRWLRPQPEGRCQGQRCDRPERRDADLDTAGGRGRSHASCGRLPHARCDTAGAGGTKG